jgi:hypothetical protein
MKNTQFKNVSVSSSQNRQNSLQPTFEFQVGEFYHLVLTASLSPEQIKAHEKNIEK